MRDKHTGMFSSAYDLFHTYVAWYLFHIQCYKPTLNLPKPPWFSHSLKWSFNLKLRLEGLSFVFWHLEEWKLMIGSTPFGSWVCYRKWPICSCFVDLPVKIVIFHVFLYVYQRVLKLFRSWQGLSLRAVVGGGFAPAGSLRAGGVGQSITESTDCKWNYPLAN